ncbi:hypothetical protein CFS9_10870 [Flavobacterium sp. CFS9]|uniref:Uncharacterized protein n=1 Tax=Flavobacterium sp. CFS9 TaxID=3143118 RepID=A0AAT9GYW6_9FLAO
MAEIAILIIGAEILLLKSFAVISLFAMKYSKLKFYVILKLLIISAFSSFESKVHFKNQK